MFDVCEVLQEAARQKASDVYLKVGISPRMRKEGKLYSMDFPGILSGDVLDCVLKIMDEEQREALEEKGEYIFSYHAALAGRYRVSVYKSRNTVSMVFHRIWPIEDIVNDFTIPAAMEELSSLEKGLILFAGDGGSGRTTGMAALIDRINEKHPVHIMTLENPIEVVHESKIALVDQREAGNDYAYASYGLEQMDKNSIDVLMYEDKVDAVMFEKLCRLTESGKLVIVSVNGKQLPDIIEGITSMFHANEQNQIRKRLSKVLQAVVISRQTCDEEFVQDYEVLMIDDGIRNRICYSR